MARPPRSVLVVDAANVVGSVPDGWWKDRPGAARRLHERLLVGDTSYDDIVLVLEGGAEGRSPARTGPARGDRARAQGRRLDHHRRGGAAARAGRPGRPDQRRPDVLRGRCEGLGARAMSPSWLLDQV